METVTTFECLFFGALIWCGFVSNLKIFGKALLVLAMLGCHFEYR